MSLITAAWSAMSQLANVLVLQGHPNESISGRCHREGWWFKKVVNGIFFWQVDHCKSAYTNDLKWAKQYLESDYLNNLGAKS